MKKTKILTIAMMLATLAGCGKDKGGNIHILAERMSSNSKVLVDPTDIRGGAQWVAGEYVKLNGVYKTIQKDETSDAYYLEDTENMTGGLAFYPGQDINGKCDIELEGNTMLINSLSVVFDGTGKHHMAFPMVAIADDGENQLLFRHLTGGFLVTLKNTTGNPVSVASLKIVAQSESEAQPLGYTDGETYTAKWAVQGPAVPTGDVGGNGDSYNANYCSEMNFNLKSGNNTYATIDGNDELQFCIPITISKVDKLVVIGYDPNGNQLFKKQKAYTNTVTVERNRMYDIPPIEF